MVDYKKQVKRKNNILLTLLPAWDPLIPPLGISCLKSYLSNHGYHVKTRDLNVEKELGSIQTVYFNCLKEYVPENKRRHLFNIGHEVLKAHMMAHINYTSEENYIRLVKDLVFKTFYFTLSTHQVKSLNRVLFEYYNNLERIFLEMIASENPIVLGLSVYSGTLPSSLFVAKILKEKYPDIKIVMGGGIFSGELELNSLNFKKFIKKTPYIDKVIIGEGEKLFLKFLNGEFPESQKVLTIEDIGRDLLDIDSAPIPDFSDFNLSYYMQMASYTSRSCPFQCNFCVETTYWGEYRKKEAKNIFNELVELNHRYGKGIFLMCDSLLNPVVSDLANEFNRSDKTIYWGGYLRVDKNVCDIKNTLNWRKGGFYRARLGIESGSPKILGLMKKKIDLNQVRNAVSSLAIAGIKTTLMFVIGYPGETEEDFQMTLNLIEELKEQIYEADCNPFWFFSTGQINSAEWNKKNNVILLYQGTAKDMLMFDTYVINDEPTREITYERVNRFIHHCKKLNIPNPYSMEETKVADERWKRLHKNAVPSLLDLYTGKIDVEEIKNVKEFYIADKFEEMKGDWDF